MAFISPIANEAIIRKDGIYIVSKMAGASAEDPNSYGMFFTVYHPMEIISVSEVHANKSTGGGSVILELSRLQGTQAGGAGQQILVTPFDLTNTNDTVDLREGSELTDARVLEPGNRLYLGATGNLLSLQDVVVTCYMKFWNRGDYY